MSTLVATHNNMAAGELNSEPKTPQNGKCSCPFIIVKYGENDEGIFNLSCQSNVLRDCIRKKSKCSADVVIDLIDLNGQVRDLPGRTTDYASGFLDGRQTYILIKVEQQEGDLPAKYTALLKDMEEEHPDIQEKLVTMSQGPIKTDRPVQTKKSRWNTMKSKITVTQALSRNTRASKSSRSNVS